MAKLVSTAERPDAALISTLESANFHPLWDRYKRITPVAPNAQDAPFLWRWRDLEPLTARAAAEVPIARRRRGGRGGGCPGHAHRPPRAGQPPGGDRESGVVGKRGGLRGRRSL